MQRTIYCWRSPMPKELVVARIATDKAKLAQYTKAVQAKQKRKAGSAFDYVVTSVGKTPDQRVEVWYDASYGAPAIALAQGVLSALPGIMSGNDTMFGVVGDHGNVLLVALNGQTDGSGGAYHYDCEFNDRSPGGSDWYADLSFGNLPEVLGLVQAEITESYMGRQAKGWKCGSSNGEGLSRVLAELVSGGPDGALSPYATARGWWDMGYPDWISATEPTDQNYVSTGCAVCYLWWVWSLGYSWQQIVQAGCPDGTLASNYKTLTGKSTAWTDFLAACKALPTGWTSDNPWSAGGPTPPPAPPPAPPGTMLLTLPQDTAMGSYLLLPVPASLRQELLSPGVQTFLPALLAFLQELLSGQSSQRK
jgi:hypothetical protein